MKVRPGDAIRIRELVTIEGDAVAVPDPYRLTHLQFRRFAGCPICSVHLQSVVARHGEITRDTRWCCFTHAARIAVLRGDLPSMCATE